MCWRGCSAKYSPFQGADVLLRLPSLWLCHHHVHGMGAIPAMTVTSHQWGHLLLLFVNKLSPQLSNSQPFSKHSLRYYSPNHHPELCGGHSHHHTYSTQILPKSAQRSQAGSGSHSQEISCSYRLKISPSPPRPAWFENFWAVLLSVINHSSAFSLPGWRHWDPECQHLL